MPSNLLPAGPEPPQSRDLNLLTPATKDAAIKFLIECARQGLALRVTETIRTRERQAWLYSIGRTHSHPDSGSAAILTHAKPGTGNHETGRAIDVVPMIPSMVNGGTFKPTASYVYAYWEQIGRIGESCGFKWGGRWSKPDNPHFELEG
jgi:peptidoglycan L-alanyl-D-glutamate endopeptidase CwlK